MGSALVSFSNDLAAAVESAGKAVVAVHARPRTPSSGVLWRPGIVVTTDHTTEREEEITVTLHDGKTVPATVAGRDSSTDLLVLKVESGSAVVAAVGDSTSLKLGHLVLAVGRGPTASLGLVSKVDGPWRSWRGGTIDQFIRLDAAIYHGFSGGALVSAAGEVLGVTSSALARGTPMAIPATTVNRVLAELLAKGHITRGYLGVGMQPVRFRDGNGGVIILSVEPGSPADEAGLLVGDVLVKLGSESVADTDDVQAALDPSLVGKSVVAGIVRGGVGQDIAVTVGERPRGI